jgi:alkylation response protein AidB-like acyl-CoA dehydrogenase
MSTYLPPIDDIVEALDLVGLDELAALGAYPEADATTVRDLLDGFGRFAADVLAPTDRVGDREGAHLDPATGAVTLPDPIAKAYRRYVDAGWGAVAFPPGHGGGGMPRLVGTAMTEILTSANLALSLNPVLTQSAIELLAQWGDEAQQARYLPRLVTGEWTGTMNLTEPDAGSDLGAIRTTAEPGDDGAWRVTGTKIFITWGEHDLADNIVHLVLARTPGAPPGTKGISLFLVPKVLDPDGAARPNAVRCTALEHKLGIHASPTCVMVFDGAEGELVGELHGGMRAMFTMMNAARLAIAVQGLATGEVSGQQATSFARERRQGRAPGAEPGTASPIIEHPDVARMLLDIRASTRAMRLVLYLTAQQTGVAAHHPDADRRAAAQARVDLLTPIGKAWCTDTGFRLASEAVQVHGGMGYVEETGIAQRLRDSRIAPIYEGTNGIQAIDLVTRKLARDDGAAVHELLADISATVAEAAEGGPELGRTAVVLAGAVHALRTATAWMLDAGRATPANALVGATAYTELCGITVGGWLLTRRALAAASTDRAAEAATDATVFAVEVLSSAPGLASRATAGAAHLSPI